MTDGHGQGAQVVADRAAQRAKELGAGTALEALRAELEGHAVGGRPPVNVVHAYAPAPPWPPTVRIAAIVPRG